MQPHPQFIFEMEMEAMRSFVHALNLSNDQSTGPINPGTNLYRFLNTYMPSPRWQFFSFDRNEYYKPFTLAEKITYLTHMGLSNRQIQLALNTSPNTVVKEQKRMYHRPYNDKKHADINYLIQFWNSKKHIFPQELFIKYIK